MPQAARRTGRNPETMRRWIRSGKLPSERVGTQHVVREEDVDRVDSGWETAPLPEQWRTTATGEPMPDVVKLIRLSRQGR